MGRHKGTKLKILDALREKAPLSMDKGTRDRTPKRRPTPKQRRHRGWRTPFVPHTGKFSEMVENAFEPAIYYDNWKDWRDGLRWNSDRTHLFKSGRNYRFDEEEIKEINKKIRKQIKIKESMRKKHEQK